MPELLTSILRSRLTPQTIGLVLTLVILILYCAGNSLLDVLELRTYDMRLAAQDVRHTSGQVAIAAIDEQSLKQYGRWPWSRGVLAQLVRKLDTLGARVIAFDVFFPEREAAADARLARAVLASDKVVLSMVFLMSEEETRHLSAPDISQAFARIKRHAIGAIRSRGTAPPDFPMIEPRGVLPNLSQLQDRIAYAGHINTVPDRDGTVRWAPLVLRYRELFFSSADVQAVRAAEAGAALILHVAAHGIDGIGIGERFIPTDEYGRIPIHYYGPEKTIPTVPVAEILQGTEDAARLIKDKIVLIGATAKGIGDTRVTPYGSVFPGVEIRATVIENLLQKHIIHRPGWMLLVDLLIIAGFGVALSLALPRLGVRTGSLLAFGAAALYVSVSFVLFDRSLIWLNVVYPSLLAVLLFMSSTMVKYFTTESEKRRIKSAFKYYVPFTVVEEIARDITTLKLGGEKRELTVLFSDIRGFTSAAEARDPEDLVRLLNIYLTEMTDKVFRHDGLLDKYIGDAIMAVFGAPIPRAEHAKLACRTALDMMRSLLSLRAQWSQAGMPLLDIGIGINSGTMIVGNMGSRNRFDYTVIGDAVNLGSRIEALNKVYGTHILLSEYTYAQVKDEFTAIREIDVNQVRGRHQPVRLYELIPEGTYPNLDWLGDFTRAYELFHEGRVKEALPIFERLAQQFGDPVSRYYIQLHRSPRRLAEDGP